MSTGWKIAFGFFSYFIANIIGSVFGKALHSAIPSLPNFVIYLAGPLLIIGLLYLFVTKYVNTGAYDNMREDDQPKWYQGRAIIAIAALVGGLLSGFSVFTSSGATIYFDNGTKEPVTLKYLDGKTPAEITIPSGEAKEVRLEVGVQKISLNGKERDLNVVLTEQQLFNIDTANTYIRTEVTYGKENANTDAKDDKSEIIKDEFFPIKAEYVFKAPESIRTKRLSGNKTKTVLYRMSDLIKEMLPQMEGGSSEGGDAPPPPVEEKK